jgi:hypothetical protein
VKSDWLVIIEPHRSDGNGGSAPGQTPGSSWNDPMVLQSHRAFMHTTPLRSQVEAAQVVFDEALELILAGEDVKLLGGNEYRRILNQSLEPARRGKVRAESERRREKAKEAGTKYMSPTRIARRDGNGAVPTEATDEDFASQDALTVLLAGGPDVHDNQEPGIEGETQ